MAFSMGWVRKQLLGISLEEASFKRRGFRTSQAEVEVRLQKIGETFLQGYHAALRESKTETLALQLNKVTTDFRGFAFEGAAMALTLLDQITPWRGDWLHSFLRGPGAAHAYMVHVGAGWALARLPWLRTRIEVPLARLDSLLRWLAVDGYGFHEGYFHWSNYIKGQAVPAHIQGYARRAFDQGLGRSLWFIDGAEVLRIPSTIMAYPRSRHADLWSGVGLACAYAGGVDHTAVKALHTAAGPYRPHLAQGAAFAAKARARANNPAEHTEMACRVLCGLSADAAATVTDRALEHLPDDREEPAYEVWRQRIRTRFIKEAKIA